MTTATLERKKVSMLIPPPLLLGVLMKVTLAAQLLYFGGVSFSVGRSIAGGLVLAASLALLAACTRRFRQAGTPVRPTSATTAIVQSGPYRFSRNPMYLGMAGLLAGAGVLLGSPACGLALVVFVALLHFGVVLPEERYLSALHGPAYHRYQQQVRRWI